MITLDQLFEDFFGMVRLHGIGKTLRLVWLVWIWAITDLLEDVASCWHRWAEDRLEDEQWLNNN